MSLKLLLPKAGVKDLMTTWPDEVRVYAGVPAELDRVVSTEDLYDWIDTGCVPAAEVAVVKSPSPSINPLSFSANGRTMPGRLRYLLNNGYTIRFGHMERITAKIHRLAKAVQQETGYSTFVHAFVTPAGEQGLRHHWDQQMTLAIQLAGEKRWNLWKPLFPAPMRDYHDSSLTWQEKWREDWTAAGPDVTIDLKVGQVLVLPRGWVHDPHNIGDTEDSVHLTIAIGERTPYWAAEEMIRDAIHDQSLRRIIAPAEMTGPGLHDVVEDTRSKLIAYLQTLDTEAFTSHLRHLGYTTLEYNH
ncbi:JmjC domain-containing protein [Micromonospora sp. bgisy143]|uniref:JmjC domain-containing protein n=1 Tax=Micromonospora sp. bgisy143 TaxID=3413790 RepID=UPI003EBEBE3B